MWSKRNKLYFLRIPFFLQRLKRLFFLFLSILSLFLILDALCPLPRERIDKDFSTVYLDRNGELLRITLSPSEKYRVRLPLEQISPYLRKGFILYEDRYFFLHPGVNPVSVSRAVIQNLGGGRIVSGASTLSMQIARMLYNRPRTVFSKILEMFNAIQLEFYYSKNELLEIYLNMIPMGGNIEGVGAAAYFYFGKNALDLSLSETALLIGIPNSPNQNRPDLYPENARKMELAVLSRIYKEMGISLGEAEKAAGNILRIQRHENPFLCPHLIEAGKKGDPGFIRKTAIDLNIQYYCESVLSKYSADHKKKEIYNGAIIVADNETGEVLAYAGSPDYYDREHNGQVNGCAVRRSPGSALKPFIYARALEEGMLTPQGLVYDIPKTFEDSFTPENFSKSCHGIVTAEYALINSLNIPAVRLEESLNGKGLSYVLKKIFPEDRDILIDRAGLSLPLGSFAVSLEEAVSLYRMLARGGIYSPLKFYLNENPAAAYSRRVLDPRSCFIISEMLSDYYRPDMPYSWEFAPHLAKAALKTGTSFGLKDAWCIGYNPKYTIGIWIGNADSRGSPFLVGAQIASPIFVEIFDFLTKNNDRWFTKPDGVEKRMICAVSGEKPGPYCRNLKEDYYIPGVSSEKTCSVHKKIFIRKKDNVEVCPLCMKGPASLYREEIIEEWPAETASFLRETGRSLAIIPPHNPDCPNYFTKNGPKIISPRDQSVYYIDPKVPPEKQKIRLKAFTAQDSGKIFWFSESRLIDSGPPEKPCFFTPKPGSYLISILDSKGRSDTALIRIYPSR